MLEMCKVRPAVLQGCTVTLVFTNSGSESVLQLYSFLLDYVVGGDIIPNVTDTFYSI